MTRFHSQDMLLCKRLLQRCCNVYPSGSSSRIYHFSGRDIVLIEKECRFSSKGFANILGKRKGLGTQVQEVQYYNCCMCTCSVDVEDLWVISISNLRIILTFNTIIHACFSQISKNLTNYTNVTDALKKSVSFRCF